MYSAPEGFARADDKGRIAGVHCTVPPRGLQELMIRVG